MDGIPRSVQKYSDALRLLSGVHIFHEKGLRKMTAEILFAECSIAVVGLMVIARSRSPQTTYVGIGLVMGSCSAGLLATIGSVARWLF
jgi:hypothetical protein